MCSANLTWAKRRKQNASHTLLGKPETILNKKSYTRRAAHLHPNKVRIKNIFILFFPFCWHCAKEPTKKTKQNENILWSHFGVCEILNFELWWRFQCWRALTSRLALLHGFILGKCESSFKQVRTADITAASDHSSNPWQQTDQLFLIIPFRPGTVSSLCSIFPDVHILFNTMTRMRTDKFP